MELCKFLVDNGLDSFTLVKEILELEPYYLKVKEDNNYPDLYLLCYDKTKSDMTLPLVRECRGIILEKNTNKVVCYTFNKSIDFVCNNVVLDRNNEIVVPEGFDYNDSVVEESVDGTQVRLFYYNNMWCVATTRCIDAKRSYWYSNRSFNDLFDEACVINYDELDKLCCYSFVLRHPDNRIVVSYSHASLVHVCTRNMETLEEIDVYIGVNKAERFKFNKFYDVVMSAMYNLSYNTEGYVLRDKDYNRIKIKSAKYLNIKSMRGNSNNPLFHYLKLRQGGTLQEYIYYYPEDVNTFKYYEVNLGNIIRSIHREYINKHIKMLPTQITWQYRPTIFKLHGKYLNDRVPTSVAMVESYINTLEPAQLCFLYNKTYNN